MTPPLRVACLGAGYFSRFHVDAWRRIQDVNLIAVADQSPERARRSGAPAVYESLDSMLASTVPDILDVITPPVTHLFAIQRAATAGVSTVICQKPFCTSMDEARAAISLASEAGMQLIVHENFRFQPWFRCMKRALDDQLVGEPLQLTFQLRTGDGQGPDAYLDRQAYFQTMPRLLVHETGVHYVDTFRYLFGDPVSVYADVRRCNPAIAGEDAAYLIFEYADGRRALFDGNRLLDHASDSCRLTFGEARLEGTSACLTLTGDGAVELRRVGEVKGRRLLEPSAWPGFAGDCVFALQQHVVTALLQDTEPENTAQHYLSVMSQVETLYESARTGQKLPVVVP